MLDLILSFHEQASEAVEEGASAEDINKMEIKDRIARMKEIPEEEFDEKVKEIRKDLKEEIESLT